MVILFDINIVLLEKNKVRYNENVAFTIHSLVIFYTRVYEYSSKNFRDICKSLNY